MSSTASLVPTTEYVEHKELSLAASKPSHPSATSVGSPLNERLRIPTESTVEDDAQKSAWDVQIATTDHRGTTAQAPWPRSSAITLEVNDSAISRRGGAAVANLRVTVTMETLLWRSI